MLYNMDENRPLTAVSELKVLLNLTKVLGKSLFLVGPEVWEPYVCESKMNIFAYAQLTSPTLTL